jgi:hypothetical protein
MKVKALLKAAGKGHRLRYSGFYTSTRLADCIANTIEDPIARAAFVAEAAAEIAKLDDHLFHMAGNADLWWLRAQMNLPSPAGCTELWDNFIDEVSSIAGLWEDDEE